jgi:hypothetical protein
MRLSTVFPTALLAASTYASQDAAASQAEDPIPAGAIWTAKWNTVDLQPYTQQCLNRNTYTAKIYKLSERTSPTFSPPFPSFPSPIFVQTLTQKNSLPRPQRLCPGPQNLLQQTTLRRLLVGRRHPRDCARTHTNGPALRPVQSA